MHTIRTKTSVHKDSVTDIVACKIREIDKNLEPILWSLRFCKVSE